MYAGGRGVVFEKSVAGKPSSCTHPGLGPGCRTRAARDSARPPRNNIHASHGRRPLDDILRVRPLLLPNMDTAVGLTSADQVLDLANIRSTLMCVKPPAVRAVAATPTDTPRLANPRSQPSGGHHHHLPH